MTAASHHAPRLCIVTPTHSPGHAGGAEYQIDCFIGVLSTLNSHEIYYLSGSPSPDEEPSTYHTVRVGHATGTPRFGYLTQARPLYEALSTIRPEAIYQRVACGYTGVCGYYAKRNRARFIWHVAHDSDVTPGLSLDGRNPVRRFLEKRSVEYGIRGASGIVTQTRTQARLLERHYRRAPDAIIPNFQPFPAEKPDKSGEIRVVWIASLKPWKHPEAFLNLADACRDLPGVRFLMVGPQGVGSGERPWAQAVLSRIHATPNLEYLGSRTQSEVNELLARSHIFVNTSHQEGFPNTFIQAWMREAVVVSLQVDPDGVLATQGMGLFCRDDEQTLAKAVRTLVTDSGLRTRYAAKGRVHAMQHHSLENARGLARLVCAQGDRS